MTCLPVSSPRRDRKLDLRCSMKSVVPESSAGPPSKVAVHKQRDPGYLNVKVDIYVPSIQIPYQESVGFPICIFGFFYKYAPSRS